MPKLSDATKPQDMKDFVQVFQPAGMVVPPTANPGSMPNYEALSLAPAPPILSLDIDRQRQFYRSGVSQYRISPIPSKANPSINASARSISTQVVTQALATVAPAAETDIESIFINPQTGTNYLVQIGDRGMLDTFNNNSGGTIILPGAHGASSIDKIDGYSQGNGVSTTFLCPSLTAHAIGLGLGFVAWDQGSQSSGTYNTPPTGWSFVTSGASAGYIGVTKPVASGNTLALTGTITSADWAAAQLILPGTGVAYRATGSSTGGGGWNANMIVGSGPSYTGTLSLGPSNPNLAHSVLIAWWVADSFPTTGQVTGLTDNLGNVWQQLGIISRGGTTFGGVGGQVNIWICTDAVAGTPTLTFTLFCGGGPCAWNGDFGMFEFTGVTSIPSIAFPNGWYCYIENTGSGTFSLQSPVLIDGSSSPISLGPNSGVIAAFDGTNWFTERGAGSGGGAVTSVFGRTGAVVAATNDYTQTQIAAGAIASGSTATTQAPGDNSTKVATTAYADASFATKVGVQNESYTYATDTGSANAYAIAPSPAIAAYVAGQSFTVKAANSNTTTSTLAVSGLTAKTIKKFDGVTNLVSGDIIAGQIFEVIYDGTNFQMASPGGTPGSGAVSSVFGRTGAVVATTGDYTAAQITNAESTTNKDAASGYAGLDSGTKLKLPEQATAIDARTTVTEAISDSDRAKLVTFSNASAVAATLAQAGASSNFVAGWYCDIVNIGAGTVTLTPTTSTINNQTALVLVRYEGGRLVSDGTNYWFIAGQPTLDTPIDADVLTFETATKRWRSKSIGTIGGANASQLRGNNISSATPTNQQVLKWITADNQYDLVLADGMQHGDDVWENDAAWSGMREDFISNVSSTLNSTALTQLGLYNWFLEQGANGISATKMTGGSPPYLGQLSFENTVNTNSTGFLHLNSMNGTTTHNPQAQALLENPGWKATFVWKHDMSAVSGSTAYSNAKQSLYIGLFGPTVGDLSPALANARPDQFIGIRYDTSTGPGTTPGTISIASVANGAGGSTVYTFTNQTPALVVNQLVNQVFNFSGFANGNNNGVFVCSASTATTVTVNNPNGVSTGTGTMTQIISRSITSIANASGGNTVYTFATDGSGTNVYVGLNFAVTGASHAANNGTFSCVASTATTITLSNPSGVSDTTATAVGNPLSDAFYTFEVVLNPSFSTAARHNAPGQTFVTSVAPVQNVWHRLDIVCTAAGVVTLTLDGSATNTYTFTVGTIAFGATTGSTETGSANLSVVTGNTTATQNYPISAALGTAINGGPWLVYNNSSNALFLDITSQANNGVASGLNITLVAYPALMPAITFGNSDEASPVANTKRVFFDYISLVWNNAITGATTAPDKTKARYW